MARELKDKLNMPLPSDMGMEDVPSPDEQQAPAEDLAMVADEDLVAELESRGFSVEKQEEAEPTSDQEQEQL